MKGLPDNMYLCLREKFSEKAIADALQSLFKQLLIPILADVGIKPEKIARSKWTISDLQNLLIKNLRIIREERNKLRKAIAIKEAAQNEIRQMILDISIESSKKSFWD